MTRPGVSVPPPVSAAQRSVLYAVRRRGEATVTDIAEMLDMTPSGARQHLTGLADAGLLQIGEAARVPGQQGRSERIYCIAPAAEPLFPRAYGELTNQLLGYVPAGAVTARLRAPARRPHRGRRGPPGRKAQLRRQGRRAGQDPRRGRLPGVGRADRRRRLPHRRAQLRHLRRRPRAPPGVLDGAGVPARRPARGRDRAGHPHDGRRPQLQLRGPPPLLIRVFAAHRVFAAGRPRSKHSGGSKHSDGKAIRCRRAGSWGPRW